MKKNKQSALQAWKMLLLSLPKGIAAFITVVAGLSVSLPLSVFLIGLPLLAETLVLCSRMMMAERHTAAVWKDGLSKSETKRPTDPEASKWGGWRSLLAALGQARSYRAAIYALIQLPVGIAAFTLAIVLPVTSWAVLLSPLAYQVSMRMFSFQLFADDIVIQRLMPAWSPFERSWAYAGVGAVLVLLMPFLLRAMGRIYAAWIIGIAGEPLPAASTTTETQPTGFPSEQEQPVYAQPVEERYTPILPAASLEQVADDNIAPTVRQ